MRLLTVAFKLCSAGSRGVTAIKISGQSVLLNKCLQNNLPKYRHFTMSVRSRYYPWVAFVLPLLIAVTCGNGVKRIISTTSARLYNPILRSNHKTNPATMAARYLWDWSGSHLLWFEDELLYIAERIRRPSRRSNESKGLPTLKRLKHSFGQAFRGLQISEFGPYPSVDGSFGPPWSPGSTQF
jgi:hypothetical protein